MKTSLTTWLEMTIGVAIRCRNGIVVGSDSSVINSYGPVQETARKIVACRRGVFVGCGNISEIQHYGALWRENGLEELLFILRCRPASNLAAMVVQGGRVVLFDEDGTLTTSTARTAVVGSGGELAQTWLDGWENASSKPLRQQPVNKVLKVLRQCFKHVARQDYQVRAPFHVHAVVKNKP